MTAEEIWREKSDDEVSAAMAAIDDYTEVGQQIIREEVARRGLTRATIAKVDAGLRADRIARAVRWQSTIATGSVVALVLNVLTHLPVLTGSSTFAEGLLRFNDVLYAVTGLLFVAWLHRAYSNLTLVGTRQVTYSTAWAVGCWFVPFLNLSRPYAIVDELWTKSATKNTGEASTRGKRSPIPGLWWVALLGTAAVEMIGLRAGVVAPTFWKTYDILSLSAAVFAIVLVRRVNRNQRSFRDDLVLDEAV